MTGFPGIMSVPILRSIFSASDDIIAQTDIVMLLTPRIIRTHEYTARDLSPIYVGTNQNFGLTGPPPLIAAPPAEPEPGAAPAPGAAATPVRRVPAPAVPPQGLPVPTAPPGGTPGQVTPTAGTGCTGAADPQVQQDLTAPIADDTGAARADFGHGAGRRSTRRGRTLPGAHLRQRRVARVDRDVDGDLQPCRPPDADCAGGQLPASGRHQRRVHAATPTPPPAASIWRSCARATRSAHRARGCWRRFSSTRWGRAARSSPSAAFCANPTGGTIPGAVRPRDGCRTIGKLD